MGISPSFVQWVAELISLCLCYRHEQEVFASTITKPFLCIIKQGLYLAKGITGTMTKLAVFFGAVHFQIRIGYLEIEILSLWEFKQFSV